MKIFVAKLSPNTTSESLQALFEQYGEVSSSKVIMDRETGRSKCYGFVEMPEDENGRQALESLNGVEYEGATIATKEAIPHDEYKKGSERPQRRFDNNASGGYRPRREVGFGGGRSEGGYRPRRESGFGGGRSEGGFRREGGYRRYNGEGNGENNF